MINKKLEQISIEDFEYLIENGIPENKTLEYKSELHITKGDERKEFLADVSAFANTIGGDLIFGIEEDDINLPTKISGIECNNTDELIRQLESIIRDSISPRISKIDIRAIQKHESCYVIIIRIGKSNLGPHRVVYNGHDKFYSRNSKGKYPMDVSDLRTAFNSTQAISEKINYYKKNRLSNIRDNEYKLLTDEKPYFVLQVIPLSAFDHDVLFEIQDMQDALQNSGLSTFGYSGRISFNIDGIMQYWNSDYRTMVDGECYTQLNRNGIVEAVTSKFFNPSFKPSCCPPQELKIIYPKDLLEKTIRAVKEIFAYMKKLDINPPVIISISIANGFGFTITDNFYDFSNVIDRDSLYVEDVMIENLDVSVEYALKPAFDSIWNACGYQRCVAYDEEGNYVGF